MWLDRAERFARLNQAQLAAVGSRSLLPGSSAIDAEIAGANSAFNLIRAVLEGSTLDYIAQHAGLTPTTVCRTVRPHTR